jgi:hypothetical protein
MSGLNYGTVVGNLIHEERAVPEKVSKTRWQLSNWVLKKTATPEESETPLAKAGIHFSDLKTADDETVKKQIALISEDSGIPIEDLTELLENTKRMAFEKKAPQVHDTEADDKIEEYLDKVQNAAEDSIGRRVYDNIVNGQVTEFKARGIAREIGVTPAQLMIYISLNLGKLKKRKNRGGSRRRRRRTVKGRRKTHRRY